MTEPYIYLLIKAVLTLLFLLGLLAASLYVLKRYSGLKPFSGERKGGFVPVKVLATSFLGQKRNIAIVDVAGEILVLGVTQSSINLLTRIDAPEAKDEIQRYATSKQRPFLNIFQGGM